MDYQTKLLKCGFSTLLGSLIVVALLVLPGRAGATTSSMSIIPMDPTTSMGWFGANPAAGSFLDHYLFTALTPFTITLQDNGTSFSSFSGLTATLFDSVPTSVYSGASNSPVAGAAFTNAVPSSPLAAGNYDLQISGTATPYSPWYGGTVTLVTAAPIPEPETYAMILAGLGLMGFVARRRRQKEAA